MHSLIGTWTLVEARAFDKHGNELAPPLGPNPMGVIQYDAQRMIVAVCDGRSEMPTGAAPRTYLSYTGSYQFDGELLVTHVDGASSPDGFADQVRHLTFPTADRYVAAPANGVLGTGLKITWDRVR